MKKTLSVIVIAITLVLVGCADSLNSGADSRAQFAGALTSVLPEKVTLRAPVTFPDPGYAGHSTVMFNEDITFSRTSLEPKVFIDELDSVFESGKEAATADYENPIDQATIVHVAVTRLSSAAEANEKLAFYQGDSRYSAWTKGNLLFKVTARKKSGEYPPEPMPDFKF